MFTEIPLDPRPEALPDDKLFNDLEGGEPSDSPDNDYQARLAGMLDDAREFNAEVLLPIRLQGIRLYLGLEPGLEDEGRSTIVATEARDTVLQMLPSIMRLFTSQDPTTTFLPTSENTVALAEQQTDYLQHVLFTDNPGYMVLQDVFKDGLIKSMGVAQWWTDDNLDVIEQDYTRLTLEQRQFLISQEGVEVVNQTVSSRPGPDGQSLQPSIDLTIRRTKRAPMHRVEAVPPDEFRINRTATSIKTAGVVGRDRLATQSDLIRRGIPRAVVETFAGWAGEDMYFADERMYRNMGDASAVGKEASEPTVRFGEYWVRIDKDDDGIAELRHIWTLGDNYFVVRDEPASRPKMAIACPDPEPHSIVGHGIPELVADLQVIKTNLLRGSLDSLAQAIYPRLMGVDTLVDWDDVLNTAIGAPIRIKEQGALAQLQYSFIGDPAFAMMDRLDAIRMARTGITEQSKGLDPQALQSTTAQGVNMVVQGAQERIELVCRTMASTFMVDLMSGLLEEVTEKPVPERVIALRGTFVTVNPDEFDATTKCIPNPAIGKGSDADQWAMLSQIKQTQETIIQTMGPANPLVSPMEYRNTLEDILNLSGRKNTTRYFKKLDEAGLQAFLQALQAKEDPNMVLAKAEADKVRAQVVKTLADARVQTEGLALTDDRERDKFEGDQMLKAADIDAKYGATVDTAAIRTLWATPRQTSASPESGGAPAPPVMPGPMPLSQTPPSGPAQRPALPQRSALGHPPIMPGDHGGPTGLLNPSGPFG